MKIRHVLITLGVVGTLVVGLSGCGASTTAGSSSTDANTVPAVATTTVSLGYNDSNTLGAAILSVFNNPANDKPGVGPFRATTVDCISSAPHIFDCRFGLDAATAALVGQDTAVYSYVVSPDGTNYIAKAGQAGG
jgi:hypothetical protein